MKQDKEQIKIITDQETVHADICIHQIQPKIFDLGEEFYPEDNEEVILIVGKYPLKENWIPKEISNKVMKVIIEISVEENFALLYVHKVVESIAANFSKEVEILYTVMENLKSPNKVKIFIVTNGQNDTTNFLWNM